MTTFSTFSSVLYIFVENCWVMGNDIIDIYIFLILILIVKFNRGWNGLIKSDTLMFPIIFHFHYFFQIILPNGRACSSPLETLLNHDVIKAKSLKSVKRFHIFVINLLRATIGWKWKSIFQIFLTPTSNINITNIKTVSPPHKGAVCVSTTFQLYTKIKHHMT